MPILSFCNESSAFQVFNPTGKLAYVLGSPTVTEEPEPQQGKRSAGTGPQAPAEAPKAAAMLSRKKIKPADMPASGRGAPGRLLNPQVRVLLSDRIVGPCASLSRLHVLQIITIHPHREETNHSKRDSFLIPTSRRLK